MDKNRFAKICAMMTSSFDGERSAAAERASAMLKKAGMTWEDVVERAFTVSARPERFERSTTTRHHQARGAHARSMTFGDYGIRYVLHRLYNLAAEANFTAWEQHFLESLVAQGVADRGATEKQWQSIISMYNKYFPKG